MDRSAKPNTSYSKLSIGLHWLMLALLAAVYAAILMRENYPRGSEIREALKAWHFTLGLSVFVLVWVRIVVRAVSPRPHVPASWDARIAVVMHVALYVLMVAMPILGWLALSADGKPIPFFGLELPALTGESKALADQVEEVHETLGEVGYWLIGAHAAAALFHHYVLRDGTLRRMLPGRA
ncbi:MAG: cytochrome b [Phenylobacterium sp.]|uniref:cytochrome b n=1 Tax=Phenylobacterium sp. TaxID=1871053 RepID=UPI00121DB943|nr:cytochrome b [Phenylobacterium sp.]TAJ72950.1 MAG: cytochrome b [Phenylobacterium sp.]